MKNSRMRIGFIPTKIQAFFGPFRQRRKRFLGGFYHFDSLQYLFFVCSKAAKFGVAERFLVGIRWTISRAFGTFAWIVIGDCVV